MPKQQAAGDHAGDERNDDIEPDRQKQGFPRHTDIRDAQKHRHDGRKGEHHDRIIHADLDQRIVRVPARQLRPDEDHGRDEISKHIAEEQDAERRHGEGLDQPVHDQGDDQAFRLVAHILQRGKVHANHHRPDHGPDQQRHRKIDIGIFH